MTIDEPLLTEIDRITTELHTTRAAFIRAALETALRRHDVLKLEQQHAQGYEQQPVSPDEFDVWPEEQHWGDACITPMFIGTVSVLPINVVLFCF